MASPILNGGTQLSCPHGSVATSIAPFDRAKVAGAAVLTMETVFNVSGCPLPDENACRTARFTTGAARVFSEGTPVLLQTSSSICEPSGQSVLVIATQPRVSAILGLPQHAEGL